MTEQTTVSGIIVDPVNKRIFPGHIHFKNGIITTLEEDADIQNSHFILPPFIDAHIHIESSMLTPGEFAQTAVCHGTGAVIADPHEIANVLGVPGIDFMIKDGESVPLAFYFGAPSCVPATPFESAGAILDAKSITSLIQRDDIHFLGEMMNFPGVLHNDKDVLEKIRQTHLQHKPVDGHAPGLTGSDLSQYINAGISTDHEATTLDEALEKISKNMKILIRNGSSAKDFASLHSIISSHPGEGMLCSDDLHPADLLKGHINLLVKKGLQKGHNILDILQYSSVNPVRHYNLKTGLLQQGDPADFIVIDNLEDFTVLCHYADGVKIAENTTPLFDISSPKPLNNFHHRPIRQTALKIRKQQGKIQVINVTDGEIFTQKTLRTPTTKNHNCIADPSRDILKICVINRYKKQAEPALGFVSGFGLQRGAMASSIAHDSHNIIAVGCNDEDIMEAINEVIQCQGGIACKIQDELLSLPLPVAGLMGQNSCRKTAKKHQHIENKIKENGCRLTSPLMTMSFLALPVIPQLKITDQGLFDVDTFSFTPLFRTI
jgi:adenine deaminase